MPPGLGAGLVERGVQPARARVDQAGQGVHIGVQQLVELALLQDQVNDLVPAAQPFQHVGRGGVAAGLRLFQALGGQPQLAEQHIGKLLRRVDVERVAHDLLDLSFQLAQPLGQLHRHLPQERHVQLDARRLPWRPAPAPAASRRRGRASVRPRWRRAPAAAPRPAAASWPRPRRRTLPAVAAGTWSMVIWLLPVPIERADGGHFDVQPGPRQVLQPQPAAARVDQELGDHRVNDARQPRSARSAPASPDRSWRCAPPWRSRESAKTG